MRKARVGEAVLCRIAFAICIVPISCTYLPCAISRALEIRKRLDPLHCREELNSLSDLLSSAVLKANSLEDSLTFLRLYARLHWDNISGFFGNDELERSHFDIWGKTELASDQRVLPEVDFLHVATQTYVQGGHSRLLWKLGDGLSAFGSQALIVTQPRKRNHIANFPGPVVRLSGNSSQRAGAIVAAAQNARSILLHNHPDDSAATFAARILRAQGKKVLFVNHADHVFTLGPGAGDVVLEICMTGWKTTRDRRHAHAQSFMGIPIVDDDQPRPVHEAPKDGPIVSVGGPGKFEPSDELSFPKFLMDLLPHVRNEVILVGPSHKEPWWSEVLEAFPGRVSLRGRVAPEEVAEIMRSASCYVDSFPLDGGTAYPQAAAAGLPGFAPNAFDASGVSPTEKLRFPTLDAMREALIAYLNEEAEYPFDLEAVRDQLWEDFSTSAVAQRVANAAEGNYCERLPYLVPLGMRDSDYNARRWDVLGRVHLPKRQWKGLSLRGRHQFWKAVREASLPSETRKTIAKRLLLQWV